MSTDRGRAVHGARVHARVSWKCLWHPGHETATLSSVADDWRIAGHADIEYAEGPASIRYSVVCSPAWEPKAAQIAIRTAGGDRRVRLERSATGEWSMGGFPSPDLRGCTDLDLTATPSTNTLAINRLALPVGSGREILAAWVLFPDLEVRAVRQRYTRLSEHHYRYEGLHNGFVGEFDVDDHGLITHYPESWERERSGGRGTGDRAPAARKARASRLK